jgi:hypothetical protein
MAFVLKVSSTLQKDIKLSCNSTGGLILLSSSCEKYLLFHKQLTWWSDAHTHIPPQYPKACLGEPPSNCWNASTAAVVLLLMLLLLTGITPALLPILLLLLCIPMYQTCLQLGMAAATP